MPLRLTCIAVAILSLGFCGITKGQTINLQWNPETNSNVAGYILMYGTTSQSYSVSVDEGTNTFANLVPPTLGTNFYFAVKSYTAEGLQSTPSDEVSVSIPPSLFFTGQSSVTNAWNYLALPDGIAFGYYELANFPWIYHLDLGWEYVFDANDAQQSVFLYDNSSGSFFYTNPSIFPYLYDFTLETWLYYYPDKKNPGRYTSGARHFYDFADQKVITK